MTLIRFMKEIEVRVKLGKNPSVIEKDGTLEIKVNAQPQNGKANQQVIGLIAQYFGVSKNSVSIISGLKSRHKIVQLQN